MSLFKAREYWTTDCGGKEEFDHNSMVVIRLLGDTDYIVTGSHNMILRFYQPSTELQSNGCVRGYKTSDLLMEKTMPEPVLQIGAGKLVS